MFDKKLAFILFCLISTTSFIVDGKKNRNENNNTVIISIPKCGTHLLMKCLSLFGIKKVKFDYNKPKNLNSIKNLEFLFPPYHYKGMFYTKEVGNMPIGDTVKKLTNCKNCSCFTHFPYTKEFNTFLNRHSKSNFLIIRDPRDMIVSFAFMVYKCPEGKNAPNNQYEIPLSDVIMDLIDGKQKHFIPWGVAIQEAYPLLWELGISNFYKLYLPYLSNKKFCLVKFENLIGQIGGGSLELQKKEIQKIALHFTGKELDIQTMHTVINNLFGDTWTFREGKIGSWNKYFTKEHIAAFKKSPEANQLLIELGYEKDENW